MKQIASILLTLALAGILTAGVAQAADNTATIDLATATDAELQNRVSTCTLPVSREDGTPLSASEITATKWYTCDNCAAPNDGGNEPDSAYSLQHIQLGNECTWTHDISGYVDGDMQVIRPVVEATDGAGGKVESILSPDRGFLVFAGVRLLAAPNPATNIQP